MRKGFTIIEILISVVIISTLLTGLLRLTSNSTTYLNKIFNGANNRLLASIIGLNSNPVFNRSDKRLSDFLTKYNIENSELRKYLNDEKFTYKEKSISKIFIGDDANKSENEIDDISDMENKDEDTSSIFIQLEFFKITISNKNQKLNLYTVRLINWKKVLL